MLMFKIDNITGIGMICKLFAAENPLFLHNFYVIKKAAIPEKCRMETKRLLSLQNKFHDFRTRFFVVGEFDF